VDRRLAKRDVEALLRDYDADPIVALTAALRIVLRRDDASWDELLDLAPIPDARRRLLRERDAAALDDLAAELNEERSLRP
jgi:hypothetical protein